MNETLAQMKATLAEIDDLLAGARRMAQKRAMGLSDPNEMLDVNGRPIFSDLLSAKANLLVGIAQIEQHSGQQTLIETLSINGVTDPTAVGDAVGEALSSIRHGGVTARHRGEDGGSSMLGSLLVIVVMLALGYMAGLPVTEWTTGTIEWTAEKIGEFGAFVESRAT